MSIELRLPNITATTEREQLIQIKSYLYQMIPQLQWALNNIGSSTGNTNAQSSASSGSYIRASTGARTVSETPQASFESIKALIIKSSEIVDAYYEEIKRRLEGVYVAQSDFGTYSEKTEQTISETSTDVERVFTNVQKIESDIKGIEDTLINVNAHIKSGLLYYDDSGVPIYGLEIGQRTRIDGVDVFDKYARFTSDKLSFYDQNGNEVAYISDRKLYINHIEVKGTFKIGGLVKTVLADGSIVKRWVGGEG